MLLGHGGEHGHALGHVGRRHVGHVADGEDIMLALHQVPAIHGDALVAGHGFGGQAGDFGPIHSGRPHQVCGRNKLGVGVVCFAVLVAFDGRIQLYEHAQLVHVAFGVGLRGGRHLPEQRRSGLDQKNLHVAQVQLGVVFGQYVLAHLG